MANVGLQAEIGLLNFINLGATTTRPTAFFVALSTGSPSGTQSAGLSGEPGTASNYTRLTCTWGAALGGGTAPASAFNANAMTFGPFSSNCNITGVGIIDSQGTAGIGNALWYGTLATPRAITQGDSLIIAASALTSQVS